MIHMIHETHFMTIPAFNLNIYLTKTIKIQEYIYNFKQTMSYCCPTCQLSSALLHILSSKMIRCSSVSYLDADLGADFRPKS